MIDSAHPPLGPASIFIKAVRRAKRTRWWRLDGLSVHRLLSPFEGSGGTRQPVGGSCADSTVRACASGSASMPRDARQARQTDLHG